MDRTGLKKPPVAPKPRAVPPSQPVARQKSFKQEDSKKISVKPLVAPKPSLLKIISEAKPLASKGEPPKYFEQKSKIPGPEDLPKSRSGPHLEHKKPECDLNPACVCAKGKCCDCLPKESRRPLQDGKFDKTCPNNRPQEITNPGSKIPTKPQRKKTEANKSLAPDSVQDYFTDHSRHGQNLIKAKGLTGSETHDRKPQNSGGGVQIHPPSLPGSVHKISELKPLIVDKNEHRWTPTDQKDKSTSVLTCFRPEPPPAHSKPIKINAKTQLRMEDTPEVIADEVMNLELRSVSKPPKPYNSTAKDSHQTPQRHKQKVYEDERITTRDVGSAHNVHAREKLEGKATHNVVPQSEKQETNCSPSEVTVGKIPLPKLNLKTEPVPEGMEPSNRYNKTASQLLLLDFKDEQAVLKEWHNDRNQNGHFTQPPVYRTHLNPVQETELEFSHPLPAFEQSVDGENFLQAAESVHQYENISEYVNIPLPASRERQLQQEEDIYEEMYVIPDELSEYSKSAQQKQRNVPEDMISSDDDEMQDSSSEEEEDNSSSNSFKGESQNGAKSTKRSHIAREIMSSEKVFVDVLKLLHIGFRDAVAKASCQAGKTLIEERVLNQILFYLPQLYELNCDLLRELEDRVAHWNEHSGIADIFLNKGPFLKMYSSYICEFDKNVALLEEQCRKNPAFAKVVQEFERSPCCANLAIKHYMLKPIQRIPQYQLLLTDYLKNLNENSQDYKKTQAALEIVKEVANHANETMKQGDNFQKLIQVQCRLLGNQEIVTPGRALLKEGTLMKLSRKVMQPRMFFLFNDLLLYTTPLQSGQYKLNNALSLAGMKVTKPNHEAHQNELRIESIERSFILSASSPAIRDSWLEAISNAIDEYAKKMISFNSSKSPEEVDRDCLDGTDQLGSKAPIWIPDLQVTMCMICTCEFTLTWRRHHCRACGKVVCSTCSANKHHLEFLKKNKPARVCDQCFKTLQANSPGPLSPNAKAIKASHARKQLKKTAKTLIEIPANTEESSMSGYLERTKANKKQWKKFWFVIKDKVLYTYAASEDQRALESLPLLGFHLQEDQSGSPNQFWLYHKNTLFYIFKSDDAHVYQRWVEAFSEATIL